MEHDRGGRRLRSATPPRQKKHVDACDEAQDTSLHLLIISQQVNKTVTCTGAKALEQA